MADRFRPQNFLDLIGNAKTNRDLAEWVSRWKKRVPGGRPALLSGPPGTGKSTAIAVLCKMNGFRPVVVNASAERTGPELYKKVRDVAQSSNFLASCELCRQGVDHPGCMAKDPLLVLDEVDGANLSERDNAVSYLLERVFDAQGSFLLARPLAFICNNMYRRGLAALRRACEVFIFRRDEDSVVRRLKEVALRTESTPSEHALQALARSFAFDIRACLNQLELCGGSGLGDAAGSAHDRFPDYFNSLRGLFFVQAEPVDFSLLRSKECFNGVFLNYLHAERPLCDLPLVDTLLDAFAADDVRQHSLGPSTGGFSAAAFSVLPLLHRTARQQRPFKLEFLQRQFEFQSKFEENRLKARELLASLGADSAKRHVCLDSLVKMLFPPLKALGPRHHARLKELAELVAALGLRIAGRAATEAARPSSVEKFGDDFRFKAQSKRKEEARAHYEPAINELIQFGGSPTYALSEDVGSFLRGGSGASSASGREESRAGEVPAGAKRLHADSVKYLFHDASMSSVLYPLEACFFFAAKL